MGEISRPEDPRDPAEPGGGGSLWPVGLALVLLFAGFAVIHAFLAAGITDHGADLSAPPWTSEFRELRFLLSSAGASSAWIALVAVLAAILGSGSARVRLGLVETTGLRPVDGWIALAGALAASQAADLALQLSGAGRGTALTSMLASLARARGSELATALLVVGLGTGFAEELFFRGYLQRRLVARLGPAAGVVGAAALFGLFHFDPQHSAYAFVFGLFVGVIALWTGSTWPAIALHALNNAASILLVAHGYDRAVLPGLGAPRAALCAAMAAAAVASALWIRRRTRAAA